MAKKGDMYECGECGVVLTVTNPCDCAPCDIICCGAPMKQVKSKPKAAAKPKAKK